MAVMQASKSAKVDRDNLKTQLKVYMLVNLNKIHVVYTYKWAVHHFCSACRDKICVDFWLNNISYKRHVFCIKKNLRVVNLLILFNLQHLSR